MKLKFKCVKSKKEKSQYRNDVCYMTFTYLFTYFLCIYLWTLCNSLYQNTSNALVLILILKQIHYVVLCCCYFACVLKILFLHTYIMNIHKKLYNKVQLNDLLALMLFFLHAVYFVVIPSHKILFLCISWSSLSCVQRFISETKLVKTLEWSFFITCFALFLFFMNFQYFVPCYKIYFSVLMETFHSKLFALVLFIIRIL